MPISPLNRTEDSLLSGSQHNMPGNKTFNKLDTLTYLLTYEG